ncbi:Disease resistance protein TAO1 [Vitis vinifera]|uniref:ADP-ribosyl cyclase/cyclic ADP-ribose hydrolase n=1 Tax=Vitis vinifera TaxID=29760 RepID=A0A438ED05_VITVI|nr:Disease resistance protein TAO1 [Vitis vinifera]
MDRQRASSFSSIGPLEYEVFLIFWDEDEDARHNFIDHLYAVLHRKGNRNYVGSSWCLDELVKIMKCRKEMGKIIFPVFHHVDLCHVRTQRGSYRRWMVDLKEKVLTRRYKGGEHL